MTENMTHEIEEGPSTEPLNLVPKIELVPHTVFLLCGPTGSGKSRFAEDLMVLSELNDLSSQVVSSGAIRNRLLENSVVSANAVKLHKYSRQHLSVSPQAFAVLEAEYKAAITFPVCTEIVVVDTTGMNQKFQEFVSHEGRKNGYKIVLVTFEYKNRSDYFPPGISDDHKRIIENSVIKFRRETLPEIKGANFDERLRIKSRQAFGWDLPREDAWWFEGSIEKWNDNAVTESALTKISMLRECSWIGEEESDSSPREYAVIGDSHECVEELTTLIDKVKEGGKDRIIVHVGDYLDKGRNTEGMVNFMYTRYKAGDVILVANHESYLYKRLHRQIDPNPALEKEHFTALEVLENNADLAEKFFEIFEHSLPFAILTGEYGENCMPVFVTHAPCSEAVLGKVHDAALLAQRNYRVKDRSQAPVEDLRWLFEEAEVIHPLHIFGHVAHDAGSNDGQVRKRITYKNKLFLDTGAVYGGHLTAVIIRSGWMVDFIHVPCRQRVENKLPKNLTDGPPRNEVVAPENYDLSPRDLRLIQTVQDRGVAYISGTMAPAPSSGSEIEPLKAGLDFMKANGAETVVLQPKYMGSRCQFYLFEGAPEKTFATSRSGWPIRRIEGLTEEEFQAFLISVWESKKELMKNFGDLVLDGELMPWSALGEGLIENAFLPYQELIENELRTLETDPGFAKLTQFAASYDVAGRLADLGKFKKVLNRFGKPSAPEFKPFKVLKHAKDSTGTEDIKNDLVGFRVLSKEEPVFIDLRNEGDYDYKLATAYFDFLTKEPEEGGQGWEGLVVKPLLGTCEIPYLKIRSPEYLRLVYGYDYTREERHSRLCRQKSISGKVKLSIAEVKLGNAMLHATDADKKNLVIRMIGEMKKEQSLDPRL